jgi:hypothetical protein
VIPHAAHCHRCARETPTVLLKLRPDLTGNCCAICRTCRKAKPYAGKAETVLFNLTLTPDRAHGVTCKPPTN